MKKMELAPLGFMVALLVLALNAKASPKVKFHLSSADLHWIAERISFNETADKVENLTFWNPKESFPSFGIGHFIWLPKGVDVPFEETFPKMVRFVSQKNPPPDWLVELNPMQPPWSNREAFIREQNSSKMQMLRHWLLQTKDEQAAFILQRFQQTLNESIANLSLTDQWKVKETIELMSAHKVSAYALLDYFNFKGLGNNSKERYKGQGWGLLDVLLAMPSVTKQTRLEAFVTTAKTLLKDRANNAPTEKQRAIEQKWLTGWNHRLDAYLKLAKEHAIE
ncbi:hypothetical protein [Hydrogenovibrio marinus]|nr:hypothetical protein [Hydrogenovibrio marinus]